MPINKEKVSKKKFTEFFQTKVDSFRQKENLVVLGDPNGQVGANRHGREKMITASGIGDTKADKNGKLSYVTVIR